MNHYVSDISSIVQTKALQNFQDSLGSDSVNSKLSNKLQLSALVNYLKSFPLLPPLPFRWCSKTQRLIYPKSKVRNGLFVGFNLLFVGCLCVASSIYLLWMEYMSSYGNYRLKLGVKKSLFLALFVVGAGTTVSYALELLSFQAQNICFDFKGVSTVQNHIEQGHSIENGDQQIKRKIDMIGLVTCLQAQNYVAAAYTLPILVIYYRMDPTWELFRTIMPFCVGDNGNISKDMTCQFWFLGVRSLITTAWVMDGTRLIGAIILLAWIFFEMFNKGVESLNKIPKASVAIKRYWTFYKVSAGFKYWSSISMATGVYGGVVGAENSKLNIFAVSKPVAAGTVNEKGKRPKRQATSKQIKSA